MTGCELLPAKAGSFHALYWNLQIPPLHGMCSV